MHMYTHYSPMYIYTHYSQLRKLLFVSGYLFLFIFALHSIRLFDRIAYLDLL